jgi:hypothetical protein
LENDGQFEHLIGADNCTSDYFHIGEGHYFVECDSLFLKFNYITTKWKKGSRILDEYDDENRNYFNV